MRLKDKSIIIYESPNSLKDVDQSTCMIDERPKDRSIIIYKSPNSLIDVDQSLEQQQSFRNVKVG